MFIKTVESQTVFLHSRKKEKHHETFQIESGSNFAGDRADTLAVSDVITRSSSGERITKDGCSSIVNLHMEYRSQRKPWHERQLSCRNNCRFFKRCLGSGKHCQHKRARTDID